MKKKKKIFKYRPGRSWPIDAQTAGEELHKIAERDGGIEPQVVVDDSKPPSAPLHKCFTWDNSLAANKFRVNEARKLTGSVMTVLFEEKEPQPGDNEFINVRIDGERKYVPQEVVFKDEDLSQQALNEVVHSLNHFRVKLNKYKDEISNYENINQLTSQIENELK